MPDPSYLPLIAAGSAVGGIVAGFLAKSVRRNNNNGKPLTEEKHELIDRANLAEMYNKVKSLISTENGKLYTRIDTLAKDIYQAIEDRNQRKQD